VSLARAGCRVALLSLLALVGCRKETPAPKPAARTDSVAPLPPATGALEGVQESLRWWVWEALSRNGLDLPDSTVIHRSGTAWVVDFTGLPLWTLPEEDHVFQVGRTFPDSIRVDGAGLCGELPEDVGPWLDRVAPDWRSRQACGGNADMARLRAWLGAESGRVVAKTVVRAGGQGVLERLVLSCSGPRQLALGRLAAFRSLRSLELRKCRLSDEQDGGSFSLVQHLLRWLPAERLVLRDVFAPRLNLSSMPHVDTLEVGGGRISWLDLPARCPEGQEECAEEDKIRPGTIELRDVPIVDPRQLEQLGPAVDSFDGPTLTPEEDEVVSASRRVVDELREAAGTWTPDLLAEEWSAFPEAYVPDRAKIKGLKTRWMVPGTFSCMRSDDYLGEPYQLAPFATWTPQEGLVLVGEFGSRARGKLAPGSSRMDVEDAFPGAVLSDRSHLVWADGDRIRLVAVFDGDALSALVVPEGCWIENLLDEIRQRARTGGDEGE